MSEASTPRGFRLPPVLETLRRGPLDDDEVRSLVEGAAQPMLILDEKTRVMLMNDRAGALVDMDRHGAVGLQFLSFVAPTQKGELRGRLRAALTSVQGGDDLRVRMVGAAGGIDASITFLPFRTRTGDRVALLVREAAPARDERDRKLTDLGAIASGVAHELRSPATYVENLAALAQLQIARFTLAHPEHAEAMAQTRADLAELREGTQRIRRILEQIGPLARNQVTQRSPVDLADLVRDAVKSFEGTGATKTVIDMDLQSTHPVDLDLREMIRVLLNLIRNASEAMGGGGRIRITTRNRECPPQIRIQDEGPGIPPAIEARLFEPFFTTKPEGTGLGLLISKRIVESNGGVLRYERPPAGGAAFVIAFPEGFE